MPAIDFEAIRREAEPRWGEVIAALTPLSADVLHKRSSGDWPCPVCGGDTVIWPAKDAQHTGRIACRNCTSDKPTGDGIATVAAFAGITQGEAAKRVADYLGMGAAPQAAPEPEDIIAAVCRDKRMPLEAFKKFEPEPAKRGRNRQPVARVPAYNEDGEQHSYLDMAPGDKGKFARGKGMSGMFFPGRLPEAGETWLLVEGCKDAAALIGLGYNAAGMPTSCLAEKYAPLFRGVHVVLVPDLDTAGQSGAQVTGGRLKGIAASVRIARLPGEVLEKGGDDVRDVIRRDGGEKLVREAIENAEPWQPREGEADPEDGRPEVLVTLNYGWVTDQVVQHLGGLGWQSLWIPQRKRERLKLYQRGGELVHLVSEVTTEASEGAAAPRIRPLPMGQLPLRIADACQLVQEVEKEGEIEKSFISPPRWLVDGIHTRGDYPREIRPLAGIVTAPTLRADGSILQAPGYDDRTGLVYAPAVKFPAVPDKPTRDDARRAAIEVLEVLTDFPTVDDADRSAWLALVLSLAGRSAVSGPVPLFGVTANVRGAGKSLAVDGATMIAFGRPAARRTYAAEDEEMRKVITATALEALPSALLDNIAGALGGPSLDAILTSTSWSDRILGSSRTTGELPMRTVWAATGNNLRFQADTARRVLPIRLESPHERPEDRTDFERPDLLGWVREHRPRLAVAALTVLRAYFVAGCPTQRGGTWGSYESWSAVIRGAIVWAGLADPLATRETARAEDESAAVLRAFIAGMFEMDAKGTGLGCREIVDELERPIGHLENDPYPRMRGAVAELCADRVTARRLGNRLKAFKGRVADGVKLVSEVAHGNTARWLVRSAGGSGGSGGSADPQSPAHVSCVSLPQTHARTGDTHMPPRGSRGFGDPPEPPDQPRLTASTGPCECEPVDERMPDGRTRRVCPKCGRFIGYVMQEARA